MITIGERRISSDHPPFVIAEMSGNHNQSLERAMMIVEAAAIAGAHALKLQTYTPDTMTLDIDDGEFRINDPNSLWNNRTLYDLYGDAMTPWEWHEPIFKRANELGMLAFSSPFDATAVDFLESLDVPCYKIASFENTDLPLIRRVAETGKPVIISTGLANAEEITAAVTTARDAGCTDLALLKCTSAYPADASLSNLRTIPHMKELFDCEVGLSDHTMGCGVSVAAVALGASIIEKHFTLDRHDGGVDSAFSMDPQEMTVLIHATEQARNALGQVAYGPTEPEKASLQFRRSLYIVRDVTAGDKVCSENVRAIRPGSGLSAANHDLVTGMTFTQSVSRGTPLSWSHFK